MPVGDAGTDPGDEGADIGSEYGDGGAAWKSMIASAGQVDLAAIEESEEVRSVG